MDLGVISVRYARALLKCATISHKEDAVYFEMQSLVASYLKVPQLRPTIDNPMLSSEQKLKIIGTACGGFSPLVERFVTLVLCDSREKALQFIAASYVTLYRRQKNITIGRLTTAVPVSQETEDRMKKMVEAKTRGTVEFETEVDPEIIGGFILEYDTYRMDASVRAELNKVFQGLTKS